MMLSPMPKDFKEIQHWASNGTWGVCVSVECELSSIALAFPQYLPACFLMFWLHFGSVGLGEVRF